MVRRTETELVLRLKTSRSWTSAKPEAEVALTIWEIAIVLDLTSRYGVERGKFRSPATARRGAAVDEHDGSDRMANNSETLKMRPLQLETVTLLISSWRGG